MSILFTHPGKLGDLLWAMPTVKAIAGGGQVDLMVSGYCKPLVSLLAAQSYIRKVILYERWELKGGAPEEAWNPGPVGFREGEYQEVIHLGYRNWPAPTLGEYYPKLMRETYGLDLKVDFNQPWLEATPWDMTENKIVCTFSNEFIETKVGWLQALWNQFPDEEFVLVRAPGSRMSEFSIDMPKIDAELPALAQIMASAKLVVTCNSVGHPLASGLGKKCIIAEPQKMRQQAVFKSAISRNTYWGSEASPSINSYELVNLVRACLG